MPVREQIPTLKEEYEKYLNENLDQPEIKPEVATNVTLTYEEYVQLNYVRTGKARPKIGSTNPDNIGAFASWPHLDTACPMTPKSRLGCSGQNMPLIIASRKYRKLIIKIFHF